MLAAAAALHAEGITFAPGGSGAAGAAGRLPGRRVVAAPVRAPGRRRNGAARGRAVRARAPHGAPPPACLITAPQAGARGQHTTWRAAARLTEHCAAGGCMRTALAGRRLGARAWCLSRAAAMLSRSGPQGTAGLMACPGEFGGLLWCVGAHQHAAGSAACTTAPHAVNKHTQHRLLNTARPRAWLGAAGGGAERVRAPRAGPGLCGGGGARRAALAGGGLGRGLPWLHALPAHRGARRPAQAARPPAPMHAHLSAPCACHVQLPRLAQSSRDGLCALGACALVMQVGQPARS